MPPAVRVDTSPVPVLDDPIAPEKVVEGAPMTGFRAAYDDAARGFFTGVWDSEPGAWRVTYEEDELCVLLEGRVRLIADAGEAAEFGPGEAFVIPRGFSGVWTSIGRVRKIYAIVT